MTTYCTNPNTAFHTMAISWLRAFALGPASPKKTMTLPLKPGGTGRCARRLARGGFGGGGGGGSALKGGRVNERSCVSRVCAVAGVESRLCGL